MPENKNFDLSIYGGVVWSVINSIRGTFTYIYCWIIISLYLKQIQPHDNYILISKIIDMKNNPVIYENNPKRKGEDN